MQIHVVSDTNIAISTNAFLRGIMSIVVTELPESVTLKQSQKTEKRTLSDNNLINNRENKDILNISKK